MATAIAQPTLLQALVSRYRVCWDVWPEKEIMDGKVRQIGFELELAGTHPPEVKNPSPGCLYCHDVFSALLRIAEHILPPNSGQLSKYDISPYEQIIRYSRKRSLRPDVSLSIYIVHRQRGPVDECEQHSLDEMEKQLAGLGVSKGSWLRRRKAS